MAKYTCMFEDMSTSSCEQIRNLLSFVVALASRLMIPSLQQVDTNNDGLMQSLVLRVSPPDLRLPTNEHSANTGSRPCHANSCHELRVVLVWNDSDDSTHSAVLTSSRLYRVKKWSRRLDTVCAMNATRTIKSIKQRERRESRDQPATLN